MPRRQRNILSDLYPGSERASIIDNQLGQSLHPTREDVARPEIGHVYAVYPDRGACDVQTSSGRIFESVSWPAAPPGVIRVPRAGERVAVRYDYGLPPVIEYVGQQAGRRPISARRLFTAPGDDDTPTPTATDTNFPTRLPFGLAPGDHVTVTNSGGMIAQLSDGVHVIKASELASLTLVPIDDVARLIGRRMEFFSGPASLTFSTDDGKGNVRFDLGVDEANESHPLKQKWRVRARIGQEGDIIDMRVTSPDDETLYRHHVSPAGALDVTSQEMQFDVRQGVSIAAGGAMSISTGQKLTATVGDAVTLDAASLSARTRGSVKINAAGEISLRAMRGSMNLQAVMGGEMFFNGGLVPLPITNALAVTATNGSVHFDVGSPLAGDALTARSSFRATTYSGDVRFDSLFGGISLNSTLPGGVKLGGPAIPHPAPGWPGLFAAVLWEGLATFFEVFGTLLDTHIHPVPGVGASLPPVVPPWNSSRALFLLSRSTFVSMGG